MNKKLIALALAGAFVPAVALAQGTNVTIYGTFNAAWNFIDAKGATSGVTPGVISLIPGTNLSSGFNVGSRSRVDVDSSNIGFRVREDLGGGLAAWGQCESSADISAGGGTLCSRNSGVGIDGFFGNIFLGQWDTPYKQQGALDVMGNTHIIAWVGIMSNPGLNVASTTGGNGTSPTATGVPVNTGAQLSFDRRQQNTINYWTPNWNGFQAKLAYGANEEKPVDSPPPTPGAGLDPTMWSLALTYDNGPLYLTAAYEQHDDFGHAILGGITTVTENDDSAWRLGAGYKFGNFRIVAAWESLSYDSTGITGGVGASGEVDRDAWMIGASFTSGPHYVALSYEDADDWDCGGTVAANLLTVGRCANTGAISYAAKYAYSLSKRTEVFAHYIKIKNDSNAQYNFGVNALSPTVAPGADPEGFGIGVKHTF